METLLEIISAVCLLVGAAFAVIGGIGIVRLPDFYARIHGAGITDTMGAGLVLVGLMVQTGDPLVLFKLVAVLFFLLVTSPTSAHALASSALTRGLRPSVDTEDEPS